MRAALLILACLLPALPQGAAASLDGFRVTRTVLPKVATRQKPMAEGSVISVTLTIVAGRPERIEMHDDGTPLARLVRKAAAGWRFDMPRDGTSPVVVDLVFRYDRGKFWPDLTVRPPG